MRAHRRGSPFQQDPGELQLGLDGFGIYSADGIDFDRWTYSDALRSCNCLAALLWN